MNPKFITSIATALLILVTSLSAFSQNAYITNRYDSTISVINTQTNTVTTTIPTHSFPSGVIVSHDGLRVYICYYTTTEANNITVINTVTNKIIGELTLNTSATFGGIIDISPDGTTLYVGCKDTVVVVDAATLHIKAKIATMSTSIQGIAISPDNLHVYINGYNKIYDISTAKNAVVDSIASVGSNFLQLAINYQNTKLYAADKLNGNLNVFNLQTRTNKAIPLSKTATDCVCVSPDGTKVYATNYHDSTVCVVDGNADTLMKKIKLQAQIPYGVAVTPDGSKVYVACFVDGKVAVINTSTNEVITYVKVGRNPVAIGRFIGSNGVLPVTLTGFTASQIKKDIQLQWQTANEVNTSSYTVERSTDGLHFTIIGSIAAKGSNAHSYQYTDVDATNMQTTKTIYYRIQIMDKNGSNIISKTVTFSPKINGAVLLLLPNPVRNKLTVKVSNYAGNATFTIIDVAGKQWYQQSGNTLSGSTFSINTLPLPAGAYVLRFTSGNITTESKFIKL